MITYTAALDAVTADHLRSGFFVGWPNPPTPENHLRILHGSYAVVLALNDIGNVIGFITAVSDGVSAAYIPHLEVLSAYQGQGIGTQLVERMLAKLRSLYMVDLVCDTELQPYYERFGMRAVTGMVTRNYDRQACD